MEPGYIAKLRARPTSNVLLPNIYCVVNHHDGYVSGLMLGVYNRTDARVVSGYAEVLGLMEEVKTPINDPRHKNSTLSLRSAALFTPSVGRQ